MSSVTLNPARLVRQGSFGGYLRAVVERRFRAVGGSGSSPPSGAWAAGCFGGGWHVIAKEIHRLTSGSRSAWSAGSEPSDPVCRPASIAVVDERTQPRAVDVTQACLQLPQHDGFAWFDETMAVDRFPNRTRGQAYPTLTRSLSDCRLMGRFSRKEGET